MTVDELITMLREYHGQDEVIGMTQKGRIFIFEDVDTQETINTGKIVIRTEWAVKNPDEHLPEKDTEDIRPDEEHPHYARYVGRLKQNAMKKFPWAMATVRMVDGWMCFDNEREKTRWLRQNKNNPEINVNAPREMKAGYHDPNRPKGKPGRPKKTTI